MAKLSLDAIERRIESLAGRDSYGREFILELLLAYGRSKSGVTRLRTGSANIAADPEHELCQKNTLYFHELNGEETDPLEVLMELRATAHVTRYTPRFIIVVDPTYTDLVALDTKTGENLVINPADIDKHFTFFLPWAGMEKAQYTAEAHADVKAAERMGKLFDELLAANPGLLADADRHTLNVFFTRLLFCFFAEDTGIFPEGLFTNTIASQSLEDGSDTQQLLMDIFDALDTPDPEAKKHRLREFPYVNGRLFTKNTSFTVPVFTREARQHLIELGTLMWQEINPDIFGSMFQAVVNPKNRGDLGQHYTSVPNILKTIEPLFLDELREQFDKVYDSVPKLEKLLDRIQNIKVFDPACGSANFLVIAYKELRRLEHSILERLAQLSTKHQTLFAYSVINIENFFGIEIDDFAVEVAILSLWIAKHQMNREYRDKFGVDIPLIPLKEHGNIRHGNACRIDWNDVCPNNGTDEIYLIGNPPYKGGKSQPPEMKADYPYVFGDKPFAKDLDYIALWFIKGSEYIRGTHAELAFVTTNSVVQGEHVGLMFPQIKEMGIEIGFAYRSFKWENNAKHNAGVTVAVLSLRNSGQEKPKYIFDEGVRIRASHINGFLLDAEDIFTTRRMQPLCSSLPIMALGSVPKDDSNLVLQPSDRASLTAATPQTRDLIKRYIGSSEFIKGNDRYCLWIEDDRADFAWNVPEIARRLDRVKEFRAASSSKNTRDRAAWPHRFWHRAYKPTDAILVPAISSERREYVPLGYVGPDTVISSKAFAVYDAQPWLFAVLTSKMHMTWLAAVGGRLKNDFSYSNTLVYNTFPLPELTDEQKEQLTAAAFRVLDVREYHCGSTLAELYDREKMPGNLREAHQRVDALVDQIFNPKGFNSDDDRLAELFRRYQAAINSETGAGTKAKKRTSRAARSANPG